jgi:hypothetical protein
LRSFRPAKYAGRQDETTRTLLILENNLGHGLRLGVRDAERDVLHAQACGDFCGFARQGHGGAAALFADYFEIDPAHAAAPAGAERLHGRFFGGEAAGVAFKFIFEPLAIFDFVGRKNAVDKPLATAFDGRLDAWDFGNIHT